MVSLRFFLNRTVESKYFEKCIRLYKKVAKMTLEDLKITNTTVPKRLSQVFGENDYFC
jgi:hypothetical protein